MSETKDVLQSLQDEVVAIGDEQVEIAGRKHRLAVAREGVRLEREAVETVLTALQERETVHDREQGTIEKTEMDNLAHIGELESAIADQKRALAERRKQEDSALASMRARLASLRGETPVEPSDVERDE